MRELGGIAMDGAELDCRDWTALIDEIVAGEFVDPEAGQKVSAPYLHYADTTKILSTGEVNEITLV